MLKKKCHIHAGLPITCFEVPIIGDTDLNLTTDEIYKCLCAKAEVIEILKDGTRIRLDFTNYDKDNAPIVEKVVVSHTIEPEEEVVIEIEDKVEPEKELVTDTTTEEIVEEETTEESAESEEEVVEEPVVEEKKPEVPVVDTVKGYTVASRNNNNNHKKSKNNKK